ncbi:hypothetical protein B1219_22420 [Pseudomonas ogarae]|nr:hypothetical protein B1219_22420 [Pseudomonas ogarae]OPG80700.1 hypothetical protein B1218_03815 [Pseudomonas ogarae]
MLPLGCEATPKPVTAVQQVNRTSRFYDCCAAEREQAPSPQCPPVPWSKQRPHTSAQASLAKLDCLQVLSGHEFFSDRLDHHNHDRQGGS